MPNHPVLFGFFLALSIVSAFRLMWIVYVEYKYGKTYTTYFYYSAYLPPLSQDEYIEVAGVDPLTGFNSNR